MRELLEIAVEATRLGASILNQHFGKIRTAQAEIKRANEWVSDVDRMSEDAMREFLLKELPESDFLGEEMGGPQPLAEFDEEPVSPCLNIEFRKEDKVCFYVELI